jgi:hypothetical protein
MSDTFPLLQKEGKLFDTVSYSSPNLKFRRKPLGGQGGKAKEVIKGGNASKRISFHLINY